MEGLGGNNRQKLGAEFDAPLFITAAHELKSPLALVRQLSLSLESGEQSPETVARLAQQITLTSERALRLTTDLTRTSRLQESLFALEPINPMALCEDVVDELQPLYRAKGKQLEFRHYKTSLLALANPDLLRRILMNFADNALHYSAEDSPVVIQASVRERGERIRLGVRDYGPAVSKNAVHSVPQPHSSRPASSGLGLYIVQQFADAMQAQVGTLRHRDGATFYVEILSSRQMRLL